MLGITIIIVIKLIIVINSQKPSSEAHEVKMIGHNKIIINKRHVYMTSNDELNVFFVDKTVSE